MGNNNKKPITRDREMIVLASLIAPGTAKAAKEAVNAAKLDPARMFADTEARANYAAFRDHGADVFRGKLGGRPLAELATTRLREHIAAIVADYRRRLAGTDRTLDTFETPGPDKDDPDCLFQNRWLRRGACGAIVSTSGVGKSSFSMQAATVWAGGQECLGVRPLRPLKIGIFQSEDDEYDVANFRDRIRIGLAAELEWTPEQIQDAESRVTFCALNGSTGAAFIEYLRQKQEAHHFDLLIINPLFAFFGGDMNDGNAMTAFLRHGIDHLIKDEATKCGCIIIHHTGKPNKERMEMGDIFAAYLGSGSGEFTNYIRSALVITPHKGAGYGVFDLIAAKHGDKLAWRDTEGKPTTKKTICYANRLPEYADDEEKRGMIFWVEPDSFQIAEMKTAQQSGKQAAAPVQGTEKEDAARIVAICKKTPMTRTDIRAAARKEFGRNRGDRAYNEFIATYSQFGLVEIVKSGEKTRIGVGNDREI